MNSTKSISTYKAQAREQLLGNYGVAVGSFVLIFVLFYGMFVLLTGAYESWNGSSVAADGQTLFSVGGFIKDEIATTIIALVSGSIFAVLNAGYLHILMEISRGAKPNVGDIFYCFKNHPDKAIKIYIPLALIQVVVMIPSTVVSYYMNVAYDLNGKLFFYFIIALIVGYAIYIYFSVVFAMSYFIYLDDQEASAIDCLKVSARLMKGQKLRYIYILLSLIGFFLLGALSFGIGMVFVVAYENMIIINMYKDLLGCRNED